MWLFSSCRYANRGRSKDECDWVLVTKPKVALKTRPETKSENGQWKMIWRGNGAGFRDVEWNSGSRKKYNSKSTLTIPYGLSSNISVVVHRVKTLHTVQSLFGVQFFWELIHRKSLWLVLCSSKILRRVLETRCRDLELLSALTSRKIYCRPNREVWYLWISSACDMQRRFRWNFHKFQFAWRHS